jgi:hypothetical protein
MKGYRSKLMLFSLAIIISVFLLMPTFQVLAQETRAAQPGQTAKLSSPAQVDSHLAGMSDSQVRQAYAQKLKQDAQKQSASTQPSQQGSPTNKVFSSFYEAAQSIKAVLKRIENLYAGKNIGPEQWEDTKAKLFSDGI